MPPPQTGPARTNVRTDTKMIFPHQANLFMTPPLTHHFGNREKKLKGKLKKIRTRRQFFRGLARKELIIILKMTAQKRGGNGVILLFFKDILDHEQMP